jgi:hypothetical protein
LEEAELRGETLLKVGVAMAAAAAVVVVSVFLAITLGTRDPDRAVAPAEIRAEEPAAPPRVAEQPQDEEGLSPPRIAETSQPQPERREEPGGSAFGCP